MTDLQIMLITALLAIGFAGHLALCDRVRG